MTLWGWNCDGVALRPFALKSCIYLSVVYVVPLFSSVPKLHLGTEEKTGTTFRSSTDEIFETLTRNTDPSGRAV